MKKLSNILNALSVGGIALVMSVSSVSAAEMNTAIQSLSSQSTSIGNVSRSTGPWFGEVEDTFQIHLNSGKENQTQAQILGLCIMATVPFIPNPVAGSICNVIAGALLLTVDDGHPAKDFYGITTKRYREVTIGGEFSHFETMITITMYSDSAHKKQIVSESEIYEGQLMMNEKQ